MIKPIHVLVVDDDPDIVDVLTAYLQTSGHHVASRSNGREALDALRDTSFDLVISDGAMAEMDGFEFIRRARKNYPSIAILLMTAYPQDYAVREALEAGVDGYITKPFTLDKFTLIFERAYWHALSRSDWWQARQREHDAN